MDALYGLERQQDDGEEWIVFGGIARNTEPRTIMLEDDEESLRFEVCRKDTALAAVLTGAQKKIWNAAKKLGQFGFSELLTKAGITNRKAVTATLRRAEAHGLLIRAGKSYEVSRPDA